MEATAVKCILTEFDGGGHDGAVYFYQKHMYGTEKAD